MRLPHDLSADELVAALKTWVIKSPDKREAICASRRTNTTSTISPFPSIIRYASGHSVPSLLTWPVTLA